MVVRTHCGRIEDGNFPVSAASEVCTGDWCLFAKFTDRNIPKEVEEEEKKEEQKQDEEYVKIKNG